MINLSQPLVKLGQKINWRSCVRKFGGLYATGVGGPSHQMPLMVGLHLLKHICNVSDEDVVASWDENPYCQYCCHDQSIDTSLMAEFRNRLGQACIEQARRVTGVAPNEAYAGRGYKGHGCHTCLHRLPRP